MNTYPNEAIQPPIEELPTGTDLQRKDWVSLNRARAKVGRTASTLHKWKLAPSSKCTCGHPNQTVNHILSECPQGPHCTDQDLREFNETARVWITHWRDKIWWWWVDEQMAQFSIKLVCKLKKWQIDLSRSTIKQDRGIITTKYFEDF